LFSTKESKDEVDGLLLYETKVRSMKITNNYDAFSRVQELYNGMHKSKDSIGEETLRVVFENAMKVVKVVPDHVEVTNQSTDSPESRVSSLTDQAEPASNVVATTSANATQGMCSRRNTYFKGIDTFAFVRT
jgi:hypothetical protein